MTAPLTDRHARHIANAIAAAKREAGAGWDLLSPRLRAGLVALHAMGILAARDGVAEWQNAADYAAAFFLSVEGA